MKKLYKDMPPTPGKPKRRKTRGKRIPVEITIAGHTIEVKRQDLDDCYGYFDASKLVIAINTNMNNTLAWETFWHEVVEAINFFSEAEMEHKSIQVFGLLLHQAVETMEYKKPNKRK